MGKRTQTRGRRLVVYIAPETWGALMDRAADEQKRRGQRVTVSGLVAEWIAQALERKAGR
jgi:hypothetical protein